MLLCVLMAQRLLVSSCHVSTFGEAKSVALSILYMTQATAYNEHVLSAFTHLWSPITLILHF